MKDVASTGLDLQGSCGGCVSSGWKELAKKAVDESVHGQVSRVG